MDTDSIKQLATDINNVAAMSFQSGKEHIERPLLAKIEKLQDEKKDLLEALKDIIPTEIEDGWWCPRCHKWLLPEVVTYDECCSICGTPIADVQPSREWFEKAKDAIAKVEGE